MIPFYRSKLQEELASRQRVNPSYSIRAFARSLDMHHASVSAILRGERSIPSTQLDRIAANLGLSPAERVLMHQSAHPKKTEKRRLLEEERHFRIIAEWEHTAILSLMDLKVFKPNAKWIGRRLGITTDRAATCLETLLREGLIKNCPDGSLKKDDQSFRTTDGVTSRALKKFHIEALEMGLKKLASIDYDDRENGAVTFALNKKRLPQLRSMLRSFRRRFMETAEQGELDEVYQLCFQLYPLTERTPS